MYGQYKFSPQLQMTATREQTLPIGWRRSITANLWWNQLQSLVGPGRCLSARFFFELAVNFHYLSSRTHARIAPDTLLIPWRLQSLIVIGTVSHRGRAAAGRGIEVDARQSAAEGIMSAPHCGLPVTAGGPLNMVYPENGLPGRPQARPDRSPFARRGRVLPPRGRTLPWLGRERPFDMNAFSPGDSRGGG